jgi:hypothetical protein
MYVDYFILTVYIGRLKFKRETTIIVRLQSVFGVRISFADAR